MKQLTLISLYNRKSNALRQLLETCIEKIQQSALQPYFQPYPIDQIHGTIIGMEKVNNAHQHFNQNLAITTKKNTVMNCEHFMSTVHQHFPMNVQIGGFQPSFNHFSSLGQSPYQRSLQVQWKNQRVVLIGWPHSNNNFTEKRLLHNARSAFLKNCNIAHKYQDDNDFFMTLGKIVGLTPRSATGQSPLAVNARQVEVDIKNYLSAQKTHISIDLTSMAIAQYEDATLPLNSTIIHTLNNTKITTDFIASLYG